jgi:K+-transporting ATPase KdpF subunit
MTIGLVIGSAICMAFVVYLCYSLIYPERF